MLRVVTLSTLFPDRDRPNFGAFVERQTLALAAQPDVAVELVSARGLPPWPLTRHRRWSALADLPEREERGGLPVHRPRFRALPLAQAGRARRLAEAALPLLRGLRCDVLDAEFFWPDGVAAMHLSRSLGIPFSVKARGSDIAYWGLEAAVRPQILEAARAANGLLAVSEALKRDMVALGMAGEKIQVHYTGVDLDRFRPRERAPGRTVLAVGNLVAEKGHRLLLEAAAHLPDARLLVAGDGPERGRLEALAGPNVTFLGAVPHPAMPALLAEADVMALASEREGLANAWVEALACGTPLVVPDVGGAREVIDRPEAGRIVDRDAAAIAAAISALLDRPPDREAVRGAAKRFSWERNGAELAAHLRRISGQRQ
jgi:glycosyltransferase involved in cell wall biosynthesis